MFAMYTSVRNIAFCKFDDAYTSHREIIQRDNAGKMSRAISVCTVDTHARFEWYESTFRAREEISYCDPLIKAYVYMCDGIIALRSSH